MNRLLVLIALVSACEAPASGQVSGAGGGLRTAHITGGICSGSGISSNPATCQVTTDGTTTSGTGSAGAPLHVIAALQFGWFGDGYDGPCAFDGSTTVAGFAPAANVYTITRDLYCTTLTVSTGVRVSGNCRYLASQSATINGKISSNGTSASGATGGAGVTSSACGTQVGGTAGVTGGTGAGGNAGGGGSGRPAWFTGTGGNGGAGVSAGGSGGTAGTTSGGADGGDGLAINYVTMRRYGGSTSASVAFPANMGTGGGAGGGNGTNAGGGSGGAAGSIVVAAPTMSGSGTLEAIGGNGGNGVNGATATGGGGGGQGGIVTCIIAQGSCVATSVVGGTHGNHGTGGGADGNDGSSGAARTFVVDP